MPQPGQELVYAVRWRVISRYFGQFCLVIAALNLVTLTVALVSGEMTVAAVYAAIIVGLTAVGVPLGRLKHTRQMQLNEAMVLAALVFLSIPLLMTIPLQVAGVPFVDALFETVSAATTTGLSTLGAPEGRSATVLFARAWMQWYGGLGIVVLSLALVVRPGLEAMRLGMMETPDDDLVGGTRAHARRVLLVYAGLTGGGLLLWLLAGGRPWEGVLYVLAAVSTGGFAPSAGSLADLAGWQLPWVVTLACLGGAVPLALYHNAWRKGWRLFFSHPEVKALLAAALSITALFGLCLWQQGMDWSAIVTHAPLMTLSAQSTAGFSTLDPGTLDAASKGLLMVAMAVGGGVGSTAGGFKLLRLLILLGLVSRCVRVMSVPPNAVIPQRMEGRKLEAAEVQDALMIILMFIAVTGISWLAFLWYGYAPLDALFDVVSATATVGLSSGVTSAALPSPLKLLLCADMLLGRLEFVAWLVFFYPRTWFARSRGNL